MKVSVIGAAGGIGQALALLLKNRLPAGSDLALYDIAPVTPGVAADLSHIPTPVSIKGYVEEDPTPALEGADVVLISAGVARKPGMDRSIHLMLTQVLLNHWLRKLLWFVQMLVLVLSQTLLIRQLLLLLKY